MGEVIITRRGGISSGGGIGSKIVRGTVRPTNPEENTVWVNTDVAINGYDFSSTRPANPSEGMLWFETSVVKSYLSVDVDATEENAVRFYPVNCRQYVNGVWENKDFEVYANDEWAKGFFTYIYNRGDTFDNFVGGWDRRAIASSADFYEPVAPGLTFESDTMRITQIITSGTYLYENGIVSTKNKIDLTPYSKISVVVSSVSTTYSGSSVDFRIHDSFGTYQSNGLIASTSCKTTGTKTIDVSNINRAVYIGFNAYWGVDMRVSEIRLEV